MNQNEWIVIKGAKEHNLKNITVSIPKNKITAVTGISGSGKTSLAFDTLFSMGKAIYLEALSSKNGSFARPKVDQITGLMPPIAISQKMNRDSNPRSTVGTALQINAYLRLLFSLVGETICPKCQIKAEDGKRCKSCGFMSLKKQPNHFSFNHVNGMCPRCNGLGVELKVTEERVLPDREMSLRDIQTYCAKNNALSYLGKYILDTVYDYLQLPPETVFSSLPDELQNRLMYGIQEKIKVQFPGSQTGIKGKEAEIRYPGFIPHVERIYKETTSEGRRKWIEEQFMDITVCEECGGKKLNKKSLSVKVMGMDFSELLTLPVRNAIELMRQIERSPEVTSSSNPQLDEVISMVAARLQNMIEVGLEYLTLDRSMPSLSGGEAQRIRLCNYLSTDLTGVLYIFDEPCSGLHHKDIDVIYAALRKLRDHGNTVIIVEHSKKMIESADYIVDIGPGAGIHGGELVASGTPRQIADNGKSLTGKYLFKKAVLPPDRPMRKDGTFLQVRGAAAHNLKRLNVDIPLQCFVAVTGVSGSGKSSLIYDVVYQQLDGMLKHGRRSAKNVELVGPGTIKEVFSINQSPIGRSQRSNIATYTGLFDKIRKLFSELPEAKEAGVEYADFSTNSGNGRCEKCSGLGFVEQDMYFMPSVEVVCDMCQGARYSEQILQIQYNGYNISQILDMTVEEAGHLFQDRPAIRTILETLSDIGISYIKIGQSVSTLSGGECQRLKLVTQLFKKNNTDNLFIFDEPSSGLHFYDTEKLIAIFRRLVETGNSVIVIEHNLDMVMRADYVIDIGPDSGENGGEVVAAGTVADVIERSNSHTAKCLREWADREAKVQ